MPIDLNRIAERLNDAMQPDWVDGGLKTSIEEELAIIRGGSADPTPGVFENQVAYRLSQLANKALELKDEKTAAALTAEVVILRVGTDPEAEVKNLKQPEEPEEALSLLPPVAPPPPPLETPGLEEKLAKVMPQTEPQIGDEPFSTLGDEPSGDVEAEPKPKKNGKKKKPPLPS